jgi:hypothetical protein
MNRSGEGAGKVIIGILVGGGLALLICCAAGIFLFGFGFSEISRQVQVEIEDNPVIVEHIGEINSFEHDMSMSLNEPGEDTFVFQITGNKGSGTLRADCITIDAEHEDVPRGELIMDSGERYQLFPDDPLN